MAIYCCPFQEIRNIPLHNTHYRVKAERKVPVRGDSRRQRKVPQTGTERTDEEKKEGIPFSYGPLWRI